MGLDRVKGYCEGHAPVRTPCIRGLGRVERSHNGQLMHVASVLVFIPFYASLIERIKSFFFIYFLLFVCVLCTVIFALNLLLRSSSFFLSLPLSLSFGSIVKNTLSYNIFPTSIKKTNKQTKFSFF